MKDTIEEFVRNGDVDRFYVGSMRHYTFSEDELKAFAKALQSDVSERVTWHSTDLYINNTPANTQAKLNKATVSQSKPSKNWRSNNMKLVFAFILAVIGCLLEFRNTVGLPTLLDAVTCWVLIGSGVLLANTKD